MNDHVYIIMLYDYYQNLLTLEQRKFFEAYYFDNQSLQEMSDEYMISRNAVHKRLKVIVNKLEGYEQALNLYQKQQTIKNKLKEHQECLKLIETDI